MKIYDFTVVVIAAVIIVDIVVIVDVVGVLAKTPCLY